MTETEAIARKYEEIIHSGERLLTNAADDLSEDLKRVHQKNIGECKIIVSALRAQLARENPQPLTPEEMWEMASSNTPIWDSRWGRWAFLGALMGADGEPFVYVLGNQSPIEDNRIYRYPPKETTL